MKSLRERFWTKVQKSNGCWEWVGTKTPEGYGVIRAGINHPWFRKRRMMAHRLSYELAFGEFDQELCVLHHCDNPSCVRPSHLFLGTHADNIRDKCAKERQARGLTHGTHTHPESIARGERQGSHKLTSAQVCEIRKRHAGGETQAAIARAYNVTRSCIGGIVRRQEWRWLD